MFTKFQFSALLVSVFIISACGGGGGGGGSSLMGGGVAPNPTPTYNYSTVDSRFDANTVSQFDVVGVAVADAYNQENNSYYKGLIELGDSDLSFSTGTDANGNAYFTIDINKFYSNTPDGLSTANEYYLNYEASFTGNDVFTLSQAPNFLSVTKYFSNATLRMYGLNDTKAFAGTDYVDMVMWWMDYDNGTDDLVSFAFGDKTFSGDMPTSSSANYAVKSMGFWVADGIGYAYKGSGTLTANFQSMTLTGNILNDYVTADPFSWSQIAGASAGGINFDGTISGSEVTGTIDWANGNGEGSFDASFCGPKAAEIGGGYSAFANENGYDNHISGTFIGVK